MKKQKTINITAALKAEKEMQQARENLAEATECPRRYAWRNETAEEAIARLTSIRDDAQTAYCKLIEEIIAAIKEAEGRATARTIGYHAIFKAVKLAEETLSGIAKADTVGTVIYCDPNADHFANKYLNKGRPASTHFSIERKKVGWVLVKVWRDDCGLSDGKRYRAEYPEAVKKAIIERAERLA